MADRHAQTERREARQARGNPFRLPAGTVIHCGEEVPQIATGSCPCFKIEVVSLFRYGEASRPGDRRIGKTVCDSQFPRGRPPREALWFFHRAGWARQGKQA